MNIFKNKIFKNILIVLGAILLIVFLYYLVFYKIWKRQSFLKEQISILEKQEAYLTKDNQALKEGIANNNQDEYMEREARVNLGYKKADETTVILETTSTTKFNQNKTGLTIFEIIKSWFR